MATVMSQTQVNYSQDHSVKDGAHRKKISSFLSILLASWGGRCFPWSQLHAPWNCIPAEGPHALLLSLYQVDVSLRNGVSCGEEYFEFRGQAVSFCARFSGEGRETLVPKHPGKRSSVQVQTPPYHTPANNFWFTREFLLISTDIMLSLKLFNKHISPQYLYQTKL